MILKLWVIGTSYCHNRKFVANNETIKWFKSFKTAKEMLLKPMNRCLLM